MNSYSITLFFHIVGALGFFIALGLEWVGLRQMRNAITSEQVRAGLSLANSTRKLVMASMLTILISGFYMMAVAWGWVAWIIVVLGVIVLMIPLSAAVTGKRMAAIARVVAVEKGPVSPTLHQMANDSLLWISMQTRIAMALGIIFLMTTKPGLGVSLLTVGAAIVLGLAFSLPMKRPERVQEKQAG